MFKAMSAKAGSSKRRKKRSEGFTKEETESRNYFFVFFLVASIDALRKEV